MHLSFCRSAGAFLATFSGLGLVLACSGAAPAASTAAPATKPAAAEAQPTVQDPAPASEQAAVPPAASSEVAAAPTPPAPVAAAAASATVPAGPLPSGTKVLHVGDSFAGALGVPLGRRLEERGVHSILKHIDSSYLTTWAWEEDLARMVWKFNPDLILITLGANELGIADPEQRKRAIRKIVDGIGQRPCVWIGIPLWSGPHNALLEVIAREAAPCRYLDTNALMDTAHMARISDGIHPTSSAREAWAEVVVTWLQNAREPQGKLPWSLKVSP